MPACKPRTQLHFTKIMPNMKRYIRHWHRIINNWVSGITSKHTFLEICIAGAGIREKRRQWKEHKGLRKENSAEGIRAVLGVRLNNL